MAIAILSLGSSLGDRKKILDSAIDDLNKEAGKVLSVSSFYETEPWGFDDDNLFLNIALSIDTQLSPRELLKTVNIIEKNHGRIREGKGYQARSLDIDIIFYDDIIHYEPDLQIPHKLAHKRKFVLLPIAEIAPEYIHPILQISIKKLAKNIDDKTNVYILR